MRYLTMILTCGFLLTAETAAAAADHIYVRANQPTTASYIPDTTSAGRFGVGGSLDARVSRLGRGRYSVNFGNTSLLSAEGNAQVSAIDGNGHYCKVLNWGQGAVNVRCFAAAGSPADTAFSVLVTRVTGSTSGLAYAWVSDRILNRVSTDYSYTEGGPVSARRTAVGQYRLSLPGALRNGGNVQVTAYGPDANYCNVGSWSQGVVVVRCFGPAGAPAESSFSILATDSRYATVGGRIHYLWADKSGESNYQPDERYAKSDSDTPTIRRRSPGWYQVTVGSIVTGGGSAHVTGYASSARCEPAGWAGGAVVVRCRAADGSPLDSRFSLLITRAGPTRVIDSDFQTVENVPTMVETPTIRHELNVVEHLCINTMCEIGPQGWDKTKREIAYDGTDATTFEVDVENSRLVRLCPVRRNTTDREFAGNGPAVQANSTITKSDQTLRLSAFLEAKETGSASSIAFKTWNGDLYKAPAGWHIVGFGPEHSETSYTDNNHAEDTPPVRGGTLVSEFRFKGDTGGDDIGNCTTDDTYMTLTYNPVTVTIAAQRNDLRPVRVLQNTWVIILEAYVTRLRVAINNYDRTKSQPEKGTPENKYFIDRRDSDAWEDLTDAEVRQASFYEFRSAGPGSGSVPATPLPVPAIRVNTFTFLLNNIVANGRGNRVAPAGDHIRLTIPFESNEAEVVTACVDNVVCGTGEPHEPGKPIVQVDNLRLIPYLRLRVDRVAGRARIRVELSRIRMEADIRRDGTCRKNAFAFACSALAGNIERIAYTSVLSQVDAFVRGSEGLLGLLNTQLTDGVCQLLELQGEDCQQLENIVLAENGDLLMWMRD